MEVQELTTFVSVADFNSFSKAARHLGYSQAAVTIQIRQLEEELQVRLFDRLGKKVSLTNYGRIFYDHAAQVLLDLSKARESVKESNTLTGSLRIGTIDSLCSCIFPGILKEYHRQHPLVSLSVTTDTPTILLEMLNSNDLDVVYLLDEPLHDIRWRRVLDAAEDAVFAASSAHPLAGLKDITLEHLLSFPLILTEKDASYRRVLDYALSLRGTEISPLFESNNTDLILEMVRSNMGITFLPEFTLTRDLELGTITKILIPCSPVNIRRQVIYHKDKWVNREMKAFFDLVLDLEKTQMPMAHPTPKSVIS